MIITSWFIDTAPTLRQRSRCARTSAAVAAIFAGFTACAPLANANCLNADAEAMAAGTLASESGAYILTTTEPLCLSGGEAEDKVEPTSRVQVFPGTEPVSSALAGLVGKAVTVKGLPYGSRTKKFNAPIVMEVVEAAAQ